MCAERLPTRCTVNTAVPQAGLRQIALDICLDELHHAAHHQNRPLPASLFNLLRPSASVLWGRRGGVYAELMPTICMVNNAM